METEGVYAPETIEEASDAYADAGPAAQVVVRETVRAMAFDREEYRDRVTSDVVETARDALFASLLEVHVGDRAAFDEWRESHPDYEIHETGSENVDNVVWHAAPFAETAVAATYQKERDAAVGTLRRQAFGRIYRPAFEE
ncbi:hypothetical protein SAMN04487948_10880 [Halogranum amylolyticum]|uniref:Uncharacterized protein n=1 Tax=Halogranum amylolyticum TaxID=660520 RepID=A0A1H8TS85_9EURY|nr:DUF5809 family protein [Halogranum amylolyticum]SEO93721.1 hypothetical protein SAMN04487948_10880 [Halogranum amylolyticum]